MLQTLFIALLVGGATMLGGALSFFIPLKKETTGELVFAFAGGVMASASIAELILPALETESALCFAVCLSCVLLGGGLIVLLGLCVPGIERRIQTRASLGESFSGALLFVLAIAMHNLPEGLAAGAALGTGDKGAAFTLALGIAVQNIPEGMIVVPPLVNAGVRKGSAVLVSVLTGVIEIIGTFLGYFAAIPSASLLPYILCLTGGAMLYIIATDVFSSKTQKTASGFAFLFGLIVTFVLGRLL